MDKDYRCHHYARSINGIVKDLRETIAITAAPNEMECEKIEIKRIENSRKVNAMDFPRSELRDIEFIHRRGVEDELYTSLKRTS